MAAFTVGSAARMTSRRSQRLVMRARMSSSVSWRRVWLASRASAAARSALTWRVHSAMVLRVGSGVEGGLVAGKAGVAVVDDGAGVCAGCGRLGSGGRGLGGYLARVIAQPAGARRAGGDDGQDAA